MGVLSRLSIMRAFAFMGTVASAFSINGQEELVKKFGAKNIKFDKNVRTNFCNQCHEITVTSTGGTAEHQPQRLGKYVVDGSLWENMLPFWKSSNNQYITPDPN